MFTLLHYFIGLYYLTYLKQAPIMAYLILVELFGNDISSKLGRYNLIYTNYISWQTKGRGIIAQ